MSGRRDMFKGLARVLAGVTLAGKDIAASAEKVSVEIGSTVGLSGPMLNQIPAALSARKPEWMSLHRVSEWYSSRDQYHSYHARRDPGIEAIRSYSPVYRAMKQADNDVLHRFDETWFSAAIRKLGGSP